MNCPKHVRINEVGPRDGLQNESAWVDTEDKIEWINMLSKTGLPYIEVTSFVHPRWIPALRDSLDVAKALPDLNIRSTRLSFRTSSDWSMLQKAESIRPVYFYLQAKPITKNVNKPIDRTVQELRRVITEAKAEKWRRELICLLCSAVRTNRTCRSNKSSACQTPCSKWMLMKYRSATQSARQTPCRS